MFLMLISAAFNQSNAQNYFPLQLDSLQFFKGVPYTYTTPSMFPPVGSMYRVIRIDSVIHNSISKFIIICLQLGIHPPSLVMCV